MTERQSARMPEIKNSGLDQYGTEPFKQQQFGKAGVEGVKYLNETEVRPRGYTVWLVNKSP